MNAMELKSGWRRAAGTTLGLGALLVTVGCGTRDLNGVSAQSLTTNQAGVPIIVSCEPHQRTLVRPVVVNGATVSQVECVAVGQMPAAQPVAAESANALAAQPVYQPYQQVRTTQPIHADQDARVVQAPYPATRAARPTQTRDVVYREPVKQGRTVKKSAIIIGSSAGVGAGVGAAVGGKKGALIGAAIGGGGAAVWDQVTRRK
jgi:hypothetical protein